MTTPASPATSLAQTVDVETPELVVVSYTVAGIGSRAYAAIVDFLVSFAALVALIMGATALGGVARRAGAGVDLATPWLVAAVLVLVFVLFFGYHIVCEPLFDGQTIGKRMMRIRVVRDGGYSMTFTASCVRNIVRLVDMQPGLAYLVGMTSAFVSKTGKRLGDIAAGTLVVQEDLVHAHLPAAAAAGREGEVPAAQAAPLRTLLSEPEFQLLERFMQRRNDLDEVRRMQLAGRLAERFAAVLPPDGGKGPMVQVGKLYAQEREARSRGSAARGDRGAARERHAIVASGSPRWARFAATLAKAQRGGLRTLGEEGTREFVRQYRDLTADLARLRTATRGQEASELFALNRLVAGAHNLLYRREEVPLRRALRFVAVDVPREIRASVLPILLAAGLMFGPLAIASVAVVRDPALAAALLPPSMLDRAEAGQRRAREGSGYIPDPELFRPVMASQIITNNVRVAMLAFASGMTAGVFTVTLLLANGVSIGAVIGLYQTKGILPLLLAFVAPHGGLELIAICVAGGAGFLLAAAIVVPGRRTRRRALVENGARAARLMAGATLMLLVAGTLEGFVSPIAWWPLEGKFAVCGVTLVAFWLYLRAGVRRPAVVEAAAGVVPATAPRAT